MEYGDTRKYQNVENGSSTLLSLKVIYGAKSWIITKYDKRKL